MGLFSGEGCIVRGLEEEDAGGRDPDAGERGRGICVLYEGSWVDGGGDIDEWGWDFCLTVGYSYGVHGTLLLFIHGHTYVLLSIGAGMHTANEPTR